MGYLARVAEWQTCLPAGQAQGLKITMFIVYVLRSLARNYVYVGLTNNLVRRFDQHQSGKERTTKPYRPFKIVLTEEYRTRILAREREKYLKSGSGKEWLKKKIKLL